MIWFDSRRIHLQNVHAYQKHLFFVDPPDAVENDGSGFPRFSGESKIKLSDSYSGAITIYAYPKALMTPGSLFKHQDLVLELNVQRKTIANAGKNREMDPSDSRENAERMRDVEAQLQQAKIQLDEAMEKGVPSGAIACLHEFSPSFLQGGSGVNVVETLTIQTLNETDCVFKPKIKKRPLPKTAIAEVEENAQPTEEYGCGCASATSTSSWLLAPLLALVAIRREGGRV